MTNMRALQQATLASAHRHLARYLQWLALVLPIMACNGPVPAADQVYGPYTNLQVLPAGVTWPQLEEVMLANLSGLGLRRTGGEGCLLCHVGAMNTPMETWDFATDVKSTKRTARVMMSMVATINDTFLPKVEGRDSASTRVTCATCHAGRINPRPLGTVLRMRYAVGGMEEVAREYTRLRQEYYGRGAYDFAGALTGLAQSLADEGAYDAAVRAVEVDLASDPESVDAHRWLIRLVVERAIVNGHRDDLRAVVDSLVAADRAEGAVVWFTLRSVGVRLRRAGKLTEAEVAFAMNAQLYDDDPRVVTDLAETRLLLGDTIRTLVGAHRAAALDPAYEPAQDLLQLIEAARREQ